MSKIVFPSVATLNAVNVINNNFQLVARALQNNVLYRDNIVGEPNALNSNIDANGKHIYNLPAPYSSSEPARLQDVTDAISGNSTAVLTSFEPTGTISSTNVQGAIVEVASEITSTLGDLDATDVDYLPRLRAESPLTTVQARLDELLPFSYSGFKVLPNKTIKGPDGKRFIARGVTMFDYLFVSYEARANYDYRTILSPAGKGPAFGISEPTYYARLTYKSVDNVRAQIKAAKALGINLIRLAVEPAVMFASVSYVDPADGLTYPSDIVMLDNIIDVAEQEGVVVQIQNANDAVPTANNVTFMLWLAAKYYKRLNVWINPANEMNGTNADVNNPTVWAAEMRQYVIALRTDIPGQPVGTKFTGPVCINAPGYGTRVDLVAATLTSDAVFSKDPNLIVQPHYYSQLGEADWRTTGQVTYQTQWINYIGQFCILVGEVGIDNFAGRYDPNLDPGTPSVNLTTWAQMQSSVTDFLQWTNEQVQFGGLNGVIGHMWFAYIPGSAIHDDNSMFRQDGAITTWGSIFRNAYAAPEVSLLNTRRALGAQYSTGAWLTGDIANTAITNPKLNNMATGTIKGRFTAGTSTPEDLTSAQVLNIVANLSASGRITNASIGTPVFQAEGVTGVKAAGAFISTGVSDTYVGFHNRTTGLSVGTITGNGTVGVNYTTVSDYRLKTDPEPIANTDALTLLTKLRPVVAGWKFSPDSPRELMFLAHEVQDVVPSAVQGSKDEEVDGVPVYQSVDYGKLTPVLTAALQAALAEIDKLQVRISALESKNV